MAVCCIISPLFLPLTPIPHPESNRESPSLLDDEDLVAIVTLLRLPKMDAARASLFQRLLFNLCFHTKSRRTVLRMLMATVRESSGASALSPAVVAEPGDGGAVSMAIDMIDVSTAAAAGVAAGTSSAAEDGPAIRLADALNAVPPQVMGTGGGGGGTPALGGDPSSASVVVAAAGSETEAISGVQLQKRALLAVSSLARHSAAVSR